jgi:hypothetical protein
MNYSPAPIDTSNIDLSSELRDLIKLLARNNHEVWARQRFRDGWRYGPTRNDQLKEHPSLVPYEELSESERRYDEITSSELLKAILVSGFRIEKS